MDTHGSAVIDPVWRLLEHAYQEFGVLPTLLERDFNFPGNDALFGELRQIGDYQQQQRSATRKLG